MTSSPDLLRKNIFGFTDETGLLTTPKTDKVFGLGLLKLQHPRLLHQAIINFKNSRNFQGEFKFHDLADHNISLYKDFVDLFFKSECSQFSCLIFDKEKVDLVKFFNADHDRAYNSFTAKLIAQSLDKGEYITIIADDVSTKKSDNFEKQIKKKVKDKTGRNALFGICRVESHAVSEIQMVDVLLGSVAYAFKIKYGLVTPNNHDARLRLVHYLQSKLNIVKLSEGMDKKLRAGCHFKIDEFHPQ